MVFDGFEAMVCKHHWNEPVMFANWGPEIILCGREDQVFFLCVS